MMQAAGDTNPSYASDRSMPKARILGPAIRKEVSE
jgi:hypothetical protein